jgi:hypothetical protein
VCWSNINIAGLSQIDRPASNYTLDDSATTTTGNEWPRDFDKSHSGLGEIRNLIPTPRSDSSAARLHDSRLRSKTNTKAVDVAYTESSGRLAYE